MVPTTLSFWCCCRDNSTTIVVAMPTMLLPSALPVAPSSATATDDAGRAYVPLGKADLGHSWRIERDVAAELLRRHIGVAVWHRRLRVEQRWARHRARGRCGILLRGIIKVHLRLFDYTIREGKSVLYYMMNIFFRPSRESILAIRGFCRCGRVRRSLGWALSR
jgi:hypothetical protein